MTDILPNDDALVARILRRDADASRILFRRYFEALYNYLYCRVNRNHADAEELTQDVFSSAWEDLRGYKSGRSFWLWLCGIARRRLAHHYRDRRVQSRVEVLFGQVEEDLHPLLQALDGNAPLPDNVLEREEIREIVAASLSALSPRQREALTLKYLAGETQEAIARRLNMSVEAVNSLLQRARIALKAILQNSCREVVNHES
ncbi:MAG: RNA polymerase sigma factor [Planctomycetota bacterium]